MELADAVAQWHEHGFVLLPAYLSGEDLALAQRELPLVFPTGEDFHDGVDEERNARFRNDEFAGIVAFPFESVALSMLAVHPRVVALAEALLRTKDLRLSWAEAWAVLPGAAECTQPQHRAYVSETALVQT